MRRILGIAIGVLALGALAFAIAAGGGGGPEKPKFTVEVDNAFGLIEGGDLKIAGVRAGRIDKLRLDRRTKLALVDFTIDKTGFGSLREDVTCQVFPQSLVGEYYVDCQPGTAKKELKPGSTIPVERTTTTVPPDLVNNVMRRPVRERLRIILGELGAAVGGNAENLNAAIRRGVPALRETNRVLKILGDQNEVLADLITNADRVVGELAENRTDVTRWVSEARDLATTSASRDREIAAGFRRLPTFLRELRPTMTELGEVADAQAPALRNLSASAPQLERLLGNLEPFAEAVRPSLRSLGRTGRVGRPIVRRARGLAKEVRLYANDTLTETSRNESLLLGHLENRDNAVEKDPRSPGGEGYTGIEAVLTYVFDQTLAINLHDGESHYLKVAPFEGECAPYADIKAAKENGERCGRALGPNRIGFEVPDPTAPADWDRDDHGREELDGNTRRARGAQPRTRDGRPALRMPKADDVLPAPGGGGRREPEPPAATKLPEIDTRLPGAPAVPNLSTPETPATQRPSQEGLLDFLLGG